jgi:hypothetical protein
MRRRVGQTHAARTVSSNIELKITAPDRTRKTGRARGPPRQVTISNLPRRASRATSSSMLGRFRCTMRVERGQLGAVIQPVPAVGTGACPSGSTKMSSRTGALATMRVYRLAALADRRAARGRRRVSQATHSVPAMSSIRSYKT